MNTVNVPQAFTPAEIDALKVANKGSIIVLPLAAGEVVKTTLHRSAWQNIIDWLKPLVKMGATLYIPGGLGAAVGAAVSGGLDRLQARLDAEPLKENWTVDDMGAEANSLPDPQT